MYLNFITVIFYVMFNYIYLILVYLSMQYHVFDYYVCIALIKDQIDFVERKTINFRDIFLKRLTYKLN